MIVNYPADLLQSLKEPFALVSEGLLLLSLFIYLLAKLRVGARAAQVKRTALLGSVFFFIVTAMAVYRSVQQIEADREYRNLHAIYTVHASIRGTVRRTTYTEPVTFRATSGQVNVGCNDAQSTNVVWSMPQGATDVQPSAAWENTDNVRSQNQNVSISGNQVIASGSISGLERNFFGNCPGGGHGELVLKGTYRVSAQESEREQILKTVDDKLNRGQPLVLAVPSNTGVVPETCDITVEDEGKREEIHLDFEADPGGGLSIRNQRTNRNIPVAISLDQNRLTLTIL
jgi:hypothetical protein